MSEQRITFQLKGHKYQVLPFTPTEFGPFALKIAAMISGPLLSLLSAGMQGGGLASADLSSVDPQKIQQSLLTIARELSPDEIDLIFSNTSRDSKHLGHRTNYDEAFAANWSEWFLAIREILKVNGFMDFLDMSSEESKK